MLFAVGTFSPEKAASFLVWYYIGLAVMNGVAAFWLWQKTEPVTYFRARLPGFTASFTNAILWTLVAVGFVLLAAFAAGGILPQIPAGIRTFINNPTLWLFERTGVNIPLPLPALYTLGTLAVLAVLYVFRGFFVRPAIAWSIWNLMLLFLGLSMPDPFFYEIVAKPDNVPIVALVFLLAYFTWLATHRAVENDRRREQGLPPLEKLDDEKVLVWPDLVYTEMICMIALSALLIFWAIWLQAPLEEPASSVKTPNPSKAPWYFLGLQEMLVYYDPWMAGVVLPSLIIVGLMAIPYIDFNKGGSGYYTIKERRFAYIMFQLGFLELWVTLIILGTFLRGPNWNFFGPYEEWDPHKVEALNNVNLSEYFWELWLGQSLPAAPQGAGFGAQVVAIVWREIVGIVLVLGYFIALPPLLAVTVFRQFYQRMGFIRYMVLANLLLFMMSLPIKMVLRWTFNLKYLIAIPEYFLNF
jgi:hypothetical protein